MLTNPPIPYDPSRGLLRDYEPSDGTFSSTNWRVHGTVVPYYLWTSGQPPVYNVYKNHICFLEENNFKGGDCHRDQKLNPLCQKDVNYIK